MYGKKVFLSLHYNGDNSYLFVNGREIVKFKAKDSEIAPNSLYLGGTFSLLNVTGLYGYVYYFSADY